MATYATLFSAQGSNATGTAAVWEKSGVDLTVHVWGTFGGGTVTIEGSHDGTNYTALTGMSFTAAGIKTVTLPPQSYVRAVLTGATTPSINAVVM